MLLSSVCEPWALRNVHMSRLCLAGFVEGCGSLKESSQECSPCSHGSTMLTIRKLVFLSSPALMWLVPVVGIILLWIIVVLRVHILAFEKHQPQYSASGDCTPCFVHARQVLCPLSSSDFSSLSDLKKLTRLRLNLGFSCLCLSGAKITGLLSHIWL